MVFLRPEIRYSARSRKWYDLNSVARAAPRDSNAAAGEFMVRLTISAATLVFSLLLPVCGHARAAGNSSKPLALTASVSSAGSSSNNADQKAKDARLQGQLAIIRYVDGEYARVTQPLPSRKKGFHYKAGEKIDPNKLHSALAYGSAANPGDQIQITNIEFQAKAIVVSINGGTKGHFDWKKHIQLSMGGAVPVMSTTPANQGVRRIGAELVVEFPGHVPDLTPDQLKQILSPFLDFSNQHSAAVNWIDTLPPEFQQAIKSHTVIVGMNQDMVTASLGRPDKKVREQDENGLETEDWIYGLPPEKSTLVTFQGNKVIRVKSYG